MTHSHTQQTAEHQKRSRAEKEPTRLCAHRHTSHASGARFFQSKKPVFTLSISHVGPTLRRPSSVPHIPVPFLRHFFHLPTLTDRRTSCCSCLPSPHDTPSAAAASLQAIENFLPFLFAPEVGPAASIALMRSARSDAIFVEDAKPCAEEHPAASLHLQPTHRPPSEASSSRHCPLHAAVASGLCHRHGRHRVPHRRARAVASRSCCPERPKRPLLPLAR